MTGSNSRAGIHTGVPRSLELLTNWLHSRGPGPRILEQVGLSHTQFVMLRYLLWNPGASVSRLATDMQISRPAVSQVMDRLIRHGLAHRSEHGSDRRRLELTLSSKGRRVVLRAMHGLQHEIEQTLNRMTVEDRQALAQGIDGFLTAALQDASSVQSLCLRCGEDHDVRCPVNVASTRLTGRPVPV